MPYSAAAAVASLEGNAKPSAATSGRGGRGRLTSASTLSASSSEPAYAPSSSSSGCQRPLAAEEVLHEAVELGQVLAGQHRLGDRAEGPAGDGDGQQAERERQAERA